MVSSIGGWKSSPGIYRAVNTLGICTLVKAAHNRANGGISNVTLAYSVNGGGSSNVVVTTPLLWEPDDCDGTDPLDSVGEGHRARVFTYGHRFVNMASGYFDVTPTINPASGTAVTLATHRHYVVTALPSTKIIYWHATHGSDGNTGDLSGRPVRTFQKAYALARMGGGGTNVGGARIIAMAPVSYLRKGIITTIDMNTVENTWLTIEPFTPGLVLTMYDFDSDPTQRPRGANGGGGGTKTWIWIKNFTIIGPIAWTIDTGTAFFVFDHTYHIPRAPYDTGIVPWVGSTIDANTLITGVTTNINYLGCTFDKYYSPVVGPNVNVRGCKFLSCAGNLMAAGGNQTDTFFGPVDIIKPYRTTILGRVAQYNTVQLEILESPDRPGKMRLRALDSDAGGAMSQSYYLVGDAVWGLTINWPGTGTANNQGTFPVLEFNGGSGVVGPGEETYGFIDLDHTFTPASAAGGTYFRTGRLSDGVYWDTAVPGANFFADDSTTLTNCVLEDWHSKDCAQQGSTLSIATDMSRVLIENVFDGGGVKNVFGVDSSTIFSNVLWRHNTWIADFKLPADSFFVALSEYIDNITFNWVPFSGDTIDMFTNFDCSHNHAFDLAEEFGTASTFGLDVFLSADPVLNGDASIDPNSAAYNSASSIYPVPMWSANNRGVYGPAVLGVWTPPSTGTTSLTCDTGSSVLTGKDVILKYLRALKLLAAVRAQILSGNNANLNVVAAPNNYRARLRRISPRP